MGGKSKPSVQRSWGAPEGNQNRLIHGRYSQQHMAAREEAWKLYHECKKTLNKLFNNSKI